MNTVASPGGVAGENALHGLIERAVLRLRNVPVRGCHGDDVLVDRDDVPECRIDGVELRLVAPVREAVGEHPFGDGIGPLEENPTRVVQAGPREAEPAQRDEGVATPVREPRIARDDCHASAASDQVRVRRAVQGRRKGLPPAALGCPELRDVAGQRRARASFGAGLGLETPERFATRQIPREAAGRRQILEEVLSPVALLGVQESAVPLRVVRVQAVAPSQHPGDAVIRAPRHGVAVAPGVELEAWILVMQGVVVAARKEGAYHEAHAGCRRPELPRQDRTGRPTRYE